MNSRIPSHTSFSRFLSRDPHARFFYDSSTDPTDPPAPADPPAPKPPAGKTVAQQVQDAIAELLGKKNNDPMAALDTLIRQNHRLETRALDAETKVGKLPTELQTELDSYRALGKPDELKTRIETGDAAAIERDAIKRESATKAACELAGIDYNDYSTRKGVDEWALEIRDETKDDKLVKVPYATFKIDGKEVTKPLAEKAFGEFPTLAKANAKEAGPRAVTRYGPGAGGGNQNNGQGNGQNKDRVQDRLDARREANKDKKNPLMA